MFNKDKYVVIKTSGRQFIVSEGQELVTEKLEGKKDQEIIFKDVLLAKKDGSKFELGQPLVKKIVVKAKILDQFKDKKVRVAKFRAKSRYRLVKGHRQLKTKIKITKITF
ncbi:50S ribosomal protein L21 [Candidatus Beckwithbacteria bacterium CG10_big_fil_rev_8_21_14_0_10_34_10]|uniref:Large ribosomal subunit protein bL21 n=1 Tax=Candidatus Beckwithbacteria bacterium CG10_big_fil_rev_8_21_14_0_10_34_10 TaxID=1974495 RepID=A0A2H0WA89_9BACT|nr:MAG: 50S ribosomal protein L21 [Candidatus Beckwithbacteria bacterium CG10_big_fil_rev_8_21_14_0_10_34_10]